MQVTRFGDGLGVILPVSTIDALDLHEGDEVDVSVIAVRAADKDRQQEIDEALATLRQFRGRVKTDEFRFDREEVNARR